MDEPSGRIVVILGMHRSGTSALAAGLQSLGVELGDELLEGGPEENPKGFFEDRAILNLSERILSVLDLRWDSMRLLDERWWEHADFASLELEACELLRRRVRHHPIWGFKNPRTSRLLGFWKKVFRRLGLEAKYVLAVRNPMEVARSLEARNGFPEAKTHLLWLLHTVEAACDAPEGACTFVEYERLLRAPTPELSRVADRLDLSVGPAVREAMKRFERSFADPDLRHFAFEPSDVGLDPEASRLVERAYQLAHNLARDELVPASRSVRRRWRELRRSLETIRPVLGHLDHEARMRSHLETELEQRETSAAGRVRTLEQELETTGERASSAERARDRLEGELEELRGRAEAAETERERYAGELHGLQERRRDEARALEGLRERVREAEAARSRSEADLAASRRALDERRAAHERIAAELDARRSGHEAWLDAALVRHLREVHEAAEQLRSTRTWRLARLFQRILDRGRGRFGGDALGQLASDARRLAARAEHGDPGFEETRSGIDALRSSLGAVHAWETWRVARAFALAMHLVRLRLPVAGPHERLEALLRHVNPLLERLHLEPPRPRRELVSCARGAPVDVVVPVYADRDATMACLESVRRSSCATPFELVVVDDTGGSNTLSRTLRDRAEQLGLTLLANHENRGFVKSANRGMALHPDRDVVLLNSDTLVHGDWLDRLRRAAYSDWMIGTATPWSNNAEICSHPLPCVSNPNPDEDELSRIDALCATTHRGTTATLPTCIGFCTYLRRDCLQEVGLFDAASFGRGYGEENDLSMRARRRGWRHVLAADTYVAHAGAASFGADKDLRVEEALRRLDELHPGYRPEVHEFVRLDPLRKLRRELDLREVDAEGPAILLVSHDLGGGTGRHVGELVESWEQEGVRAYEILPADSCEAERVALRQRAVGGTPNLLYRLPDEFDSLSRDLSRLGILHVHFHHVLGLPEAVRALPERLGLQYDFTVHDYLSICPRVHLVDGSGSYCGEPENENVCSACVRANGSPVGEEVDVRSWREDFGRFLQSARRVFVPNEDVRVRLASYFPGVEFATRPHAESPIKALPSTSSTPGKARRVAVIGAIGPHKGSAVLEACARDAEARKLPLEFHLVGYSDRDEVLESLPCVRITGRYEEAEVYDLLAARRCHLAFFPAVWPETHCYTLSVALGARLYPIAFDLGAVAQRIQEVGWGELLPLASGARAINDRLLAAVPPKFPTERYERTGAVYADMRFDYYGAPF